MFLNYNFIIIIHIYTILIQIHELWWLTEEKTILNKKPKWKWEKSQTKKKYVLIIVFIYLLFFMYLDFFFFFLVYNTLVTSLSVWKTTTRWQCSIHDETPVRGIVSPPAEGSDEPCLRELYVHINLNPI